MKRSRHNDSSSHFDVTQAAMQKSNYREVINSSKDFNEQKASISYSKEFQIKEKIMYSSNDFQRKVISSSKDFYQQNKAKKL